MNMGKNEGCGYERKKKHNIDSCYGLGVEHRFKRSVLDLAVAAISDDNFLSQLIP